MTTQKMEAALTALTNSTMMPLVDMIPMNIIESKS